MAKRPVKHKPKKGGNKKKRKQPNRAPCAPRRGTRLQTFDDRHHIEAVAK